MPPKPTEEIYKLSLIDNYAADVEMWNRFNIRQLLDRFMPQHEIETFRELQFETGMLISGSAALQFFDVRHFEGSDLDLYVNHKNRMPIIHWITSLQYVFVPSPPGSSQTLLDAVGPLYGSETDIVQSQLRQDGAYKCAASILTFVHEERQEKIQLVTVYGHPLQMVLNFHSTCVMNVISHDCAYSLYPDITFVDRLSLYNHPINLEEKDNITPKYEARGWLLVPTAHPRHIDDPGHSLFPGLRSLGDERCWRVFLYPKQKRNEDVIDHLNTWSQTFNESNEPTISFSLFTSDLLNRDFVVGSALAHALIHRQDLHFSNILRLTLGDIDDAVIDSDDMSID